MLISSRFGDSRCAGGHSGSPLLKEGDRPRREQDRRRQGSRRQRRGDRRPDAGTTRAVHSELRGRLDHGGPGQRAARRRPTLGPSPLRRDQGSAHQHRFRQDHGPRAGGANGPARLEPGRCPGRGARAGPAKALAAERVRRWEESKAHRARAKADRAERQASRRAAWDAERAGTIVHVGPEHSQGLQR